MGGIQAPKGARNKDRGSSQNRICRDPEVRTRGLVLEAENNVKPPEASQARGQGR